MNPLKCIESVANKHLNRHLHLQDHVFAAVGLHMEHCLTATAVATAIAVVVGLRMRAHVQPRGRLTWSTYTVQQ